VHLLFLDESGRLGQHSLFALGGVAVRDTDWQVLRDAWQATLREHAWPLDKEIKWHGVRNGSVPPALADAVFATLAKAPFTAYVRCSTSNSVARPSPSSSPATTRSTRRP